VEPLSHEGVIPLLAEHLRPIFDASPDGSVFHAETDMIPFTFEGHTIAYHFVRRVGD
jgi:hypothetical protein